MLLLITVLFGQALAMSRAYFPYCILTVYEHRNGEGFNISWDTRDWPTVNPYRHNIWPTIARSISSFRVSGTACELQLFDQYNQRGRVIEIYDKHLYNVDWYLNDNVWSFSLRRTDCDSSGRLVWYGRRLEGEGEAPAPPKNVLSSEDGVFSVTPVAEEDDKSSESSLHIDGDAFSGEDLGQIADSLMILEKFGFQVTQPQDASSQDLEGDE